MGDRCWCTLTVPNYAAEDAEKIFTSDFGECDEKNKSDDQCEFIFHEVNYGDLPCIGELKAAGIPYDWHWDAGSEYGPGDEYCRFTSTGEISIRTVNESDQNPYLMDLMALIDQPDQLRQYILDHKESVSYPSWDNQEEYSKRYLVRQLVEPN